MRTGGTLPGSIPAPPYPARCSSACRTCPRDATSCVLDTLAARVRHRAARPSTSTPITTDRCSRWPATDLLERRARARARGGRTRRSPGARRRASATRRARRRAVRRARRRRHRPRPSTRRATFAVWIADALAVPVFLYDAADPRRALAARHAPRRVRPPRPRPRACAPRTPRWARSRSAPARRSSR